MNKQKKNRNGSNSRDVTEVVITRSSSTSPPPTAGGAPINSNIMLRVRAQLGGLLSPKKFCIDADVVRH